MKKWMMIFGAGLMAFTLAACNTIEGAGKDIEETGDSIEGAAQGAQT